VPQEGPGPCRVPGAGGAGGGPVPSRGSGAAMPRGQFCAQGTLALPLVLPPQQLRDRVGGCHPQAGLPMGKEGSRRQRGSASGSPPVPVHVPQGWWVLSGSSPGPAGSGTVPAPAQGCWSSACATAAAAAARGGWVFSQTLALSQREMEHFWCPTPIPPSPPIASAWPWEATAESTGERPGRAAHAHEAAGFPGAAARGALCCATRSSDCPTSLPAQGQTDGRRSPNHVGAPTTGETCTSRGSPREKLGRLCQGWCWCLPFVWPRSWLCVCLPGSARPGMLRGLHSSSLGAASGQLLLPLFGFVSAPACGRLQFICGSSSWTALARFSSSPFQVQLLDGCSSSAASGWLFLASFLSGPARGRLQFGGSSSSFQLQFIHGASSFHLPLVAAPAHLFLPLACFRPSPSLFLLPARVRLQLGFIFSGFASAPAGPWLQPRSISAALNYSWCLFRSPWLPAGSQITHCPHVDPRPRRTPARAPAAATGGTRRRRRPPGLKSARPRPAQAP